VPLAFLLILLALASFALSQTRIEKFLHEKKARRKISPPSSAGVSAWSISTRNRNTKRYFTLRPNR
jgi:hypothetical protein